MRTVETAAGLIEASAASGWAGSDPYDGLWWGWPAPLTAGRRRRQAIIQLHARSPVDVRRLYRRPPSLLAKALGLFGSASVRLLALTGDERFRGLALDALERLAADTRAGERAWGYPWDTQTRWSYYRADSPNVVVTAFAARALGEGATALGEPRFAERAAGAARWVLEELYREPRGFFAYHGASDVLVHNASLLGARLVHTALPAGEGDAAVRRALERTLEAQAPDGSWPYGDGMAFVDSFHTGYVLDCLASLRDVDSAVDEAIGRGAAYYTGRFFEADGGARLWPDRPYPLDGHSAGTALSALSTLTDLGHADQDLLARVARHTSTEMVRGRHAVFRRHRRWHTTVRYPRWCDGHVAAGLADAAAALGDGARSGDPQNSSVDASVG